MAMTPLEAKARLGDIKADLRLPALAWANHPGPQGDLYRALAKTVAFLSDALA